MNMITKFKSCRHSANTPHFEKHPQQQKNSIKNPQINIGIFRKANRKVIIQQIIIQHHLKVMRKQHKAEQETQAEIRPQLNLQQLITLTQDLLRDLIESEGTQCQSIFNSQEVPSISLEAYLRRIHKYTQFSPQCLIIAIVYLDRYNMAQAEFSLNWNNVHRMILTCLMLAVKFHDDIYFDNQTYQRGGGVSSSQLFKFELEVFGKIGFNAYVDDQEYDALVERLCSVYNEEQQQ